MLCDSTFPAGQLEFASKQLVAAVQTNTGSIAGQSGMLLSLDQMASTFWSESSAGELGRRSNISNRGMQYLQQQENLQESGMVKGACFALQYAAASYTAKLHVCPCEKVQLHTWTTCSTMLCCYC
jgi:hypothetical protein